MLHKIIYKNFKSNIRKYILFFVSNIIAVAELFIFWGLNDVVVRAVTEPSIMMGIKSDFMIAVGLYSQEQDWIGLNDYLNELSEDILDYNYQIWTGNRMLDMILNEKLKEAKDKKIDMQISTEVFTTLPFTDREIISLFGNLLDNAIEACERITDKNTWIHIKMKKKNQLLYFEIKNTTEHTVQPVPGKFISTKTNGTLHGYGMKNIMDVVEKYRGIFQSQMVEDYFVVMISVYADIYSK